jgi:hypothetical protein
MDDAEKNLSKLLEALAPEDNLGILLAMQMGGTPQEIQLILQTTEYHAEKEALRVTGQYIVRAIGVVEHHASLGFFRNLVVSKDNPLLYPHNEKLMQVVFRGTPEAVDSLMIDLHQLYGQTYGIYDPNRRMADELNRSQPLTTLLNGGEGVLGIMPEPFAKRLSKVLERHQMWVELVDVMETHRPEGITFQSLVMDDSYIIAQAFSVDPMGMPK